MAAAARSPTCSSRATASRCSTSCSRSRAGRSVVAVGALHALVAFLRLDAERRDRPGLQPTQADPLVGLLAEAVGAVLEAAQRLVDLGDQLAFAVARAQLERAVGFQRRAVGDIRFGQAFLLQVLERLRRVLQQLRAPGEQLLAKVFRLHRIHERLVLGRTIVGGQQRLHAVTLTLTQWSPSRKTAAEYMVF